MRGLILSGGAFKGAIQLPVIEWLNTQHQYDFVYGVSVGSLNGVMFAQDKLKELRHFWESVDGKSMFLKRNLWPFKGLYSMDPLRAHIDSNVSLGNLKIPFATGVVSLTDGAYHNLCSMEMKHDKELHDSIQASCAMPGLMVLPNITINNQIHLVSDGGLRNILPIPPIRNFLNLDIIMCNQLHFVKTTKAKNIIGSFTRGLETMEQKLFLKEISKLHTPNNSPTKITIYYPQRDPGSSFKASKKIIRRRFDLGYEAINNPWTFEIS